MIGKKYTCYQKNLLLSPRYEVSNSKSFANVLFLNAKIFKMHVVDTLLCGFCKEKNETPIHLFSQMCDHNILLGISAGKLKPSLELPNFTPESALLVITTPVDNDSFFLLFW